MLPLPLPYKTLPPLAYQSTQVDIDLWVKPRAPAWRPAKQLICVIVVIIIIPAGGGLTHLPLPIQLNFHHKLKIAHTHTHTFAGSWDSLLTCAASTLMRALVPDLFLKRKALFTQDAQADLCTNLCAYPLMLLATCVNTPTYCSEFHNLHARVARCFASCVNWA